MPVTMEEYRRSLKEPALAEQLKIRDLLDNVAVQMNGSLVAGYELGGLHSYYGSDDDRQRCQEAGFAVVLTKPVEPEELERVLADGPAPPES